MLLAIKNTEGKGVYFCEDNKHRNKIVQKYPGCSHRIFNDNENKAACKWAGVSNVVNETNRVESQTKKYNNKLATPKSIQQAVTPANNSFMLFINHLYHLNAETAVIKLVDNTEIKIILKDLKTILRTIRDSWYGTCRYSHDRDEMLNFYTTDVTSMHQFEERVKHAYEQDSESNLNFKDWLFVVFKALDEDEDHADWYETTFASKLTSFGNIIKIENPNNHKTIAINSDHVVSITPMFTDDDIYSTTGVLRNKDILSALNRFETYKSKQNNET